jgi:diguanylate cyclase (GGDEF)-like protein
VRPTPLEKLTIATDGEVMAGDVRKSSRPGLPRRGRLAGLRIPYWAGAVLAAMSAGASLALALVSPLASDGTNCITLVVIALLLMYGPRRLVLPKRTLRLLIWALTAALAAAAMNVVWELVTGHPPSHPWIGDAVAFPYVPFTVAALLLVPAGSQRTGYRARALADGIVASSCLWYLIVLAGNHLAGGAGHGGWDIAGFVVAAGDVCVVATALTVLARCSASMTPIVGGIAVGVTVLSVNDVWLVISGQNVYAARPVLMFQFGLMLLATAAVLRGPASDRAIDGFARLRWVLGSAPFLPLLVCIAVTVAIAADGGGLQENEVVPALFLVMALVARQYVGARDKQRLVDRLREREIGLQAALRRDTLTGLGNRLALTERLSAVLDDRRQWPVAVALLDLNEFKLINDNHGHAIGDQVLCQAAGRLASTVRDEDLVVRLGGDEFAVVGTRLHVADRDAFAARLVAAFATPIMVEPARFNVSVSVGIVLGQAPETPEMLLAHADAAMYQAKEDGRAVSQVRILEHDERSRIARNLSIREQIMHPELDQFHIHYQPIVELATGRTRGFEALLRWHHPDMGSISPEVFIPLAERAGSVAALGHHVLTTAAKDMARLGWRRPDERPFVSVNVSPRELVRDCFADSVLATLTTCGLTPDRLMLEVTEQAFTADLAPIEAALQRLSAAGVTIAIDDFGTGYSTLRYVRRLRPHTIKIDRSFIAGLSDDQAACKLVDAVHTMAEMLELRMAAEGIETEEQLRFLRAIGCEFGQGYLFSRAVPVDELESLLAEAHATPPPDRAIRPV